MREIKKIIIHAAATKPDMDIGVTEIDNWHSARGFSGIGYHLVIRRNGELESGRPLQKAGAHAKGFNSDSIGICMVGGIDESGKSEDNFTDAQWSTLRRTIKGFQVIYGLPVSRIFGHRELAGVNKDCPCFDVETWIKNNMEKV